MFFAGERGLADPGHAFAAHVGEGRGAAVHPGHHVVAADAGDGAREPSGTRVEVLCGQPEQKCGLRSASTMGCLCRLLLGGDDLQAGGDGRRGEEAADALGDDAGDGGHRQFAGGRQQPVAFRPLADFSSNLPMTRGRTSSRQL